MENNQKVQSLMTPLAAEQIYNKLVELKADVTKEHAARLRAAKEKCHWQINDDDTPYKKMKEVNATCIVVKDSLTNKLFEKFIPWSEKYVATSDYEEHIGYTNVVKGWFGRTKSQGSVHKKGIDPNSDWIQDFIDAECDGNMRGWVIRELMKHPFITNRESAEFALDYILSVTNTSLWPKCPRRAAESFNREGPKNVGRHAIMNIAMEKAKTNVHFYSMDALMREPYLRKTQERYFKMFGWNDWNRAISSMHWASLWLNKEIEYFKKAMVNYGTTQVMLDAERVKCAHETGHGFTGKTLLEWYDKNQAEIYWCTFQNCYIYFDPNED